MGRPRIHKDDAARQKAYRDRLRAARAAAPAPIEERVAAVVRRIAPEIDTTELRRGR